MSDPQDEKQTRRAKRRAEREARAEAERPESAAEADADVEEDESADAEAGEAETEAEAAPQPTRAERRAAKKNKKKSGEAASTEEIRDRNRRVREQAAARRREKRDGDRRSATARGLDAGEMVDDALARASHNATLWLKKHFNIIQWVIVLAVAGGIGWQIWSWRHGKTVAKASDTLMTAVEAEMGHVGEAPPPDPLTGEPDGKPVFATDEARLEAAAKAYRDAADQRKGSGTAILAKLGLAGIHYDQGKYDDAIAAYEDVKNSELAQHDADVRLRAVEGIGLAHEAKKDWDKAIKSFKELENSDVAGFKALALYHQARVVYAKGNKENAKELLKAAQEQLTKEKSAYQTASYLDAATRELSATIDPSTAPVVPYSPAEAAALQEQIMKDPTKLQKMLEEMGKLGKELPQIPDVPAPPVPLPEAPPEAPEAPAPE